MNLPSAQRTRTPLLLAFAIGFFCFSIAHSAMADCPNPDKIVKDFLYGLRDLNAAASCAVLDDAVLYQRSGLVDIVGKPSVQAELTSVFEVLPEFRLQVSRIHRKRNVIAAERLQYQRVANPLPPGSSFGNPGAELTSRVISFFEVTEACKISRWSDYYDVSGLERQLGFPVTYASE